MTKMNENKQIEEIKNTLLANTPIIDMPFECFEEVAKAIYSAGYRKQSDIAQEIIDKIMEVGIIRYNSKNAKEYYEFEVKKLDNFINQLEKEYGVED